MTLVTGGAIGISGLNAGMLADDGNGVRSSFLKIFCCSVALCVWLSLRHDDWKSDSVNSGNLDVTEVSSALRNGCE